MKSLKNKERLTALIVALLILFVQYKDQIIADLPEEYMWLSGFITVAALLISQLIVEKRVIRAEELKEQELTDNI